MMAVRASMLGARTRVFSQSEIEGRVDRARSIFDPDPDFGDDITDSGHVAEEVVVKRESSDSVDIGDIMDCRKRTQDACNNGRETKAGMVITLSMLGTIVLSVTMIILDSLNYQYCDNPCPVQTTNASYEEEWPVAKQSEYIRSNMDDMLNTGVDMEPSGTAFFIVHLPGACYVPACQAPKDTYCTYIRDRGQLSFSQLLGFEIFSTIIFTIEFIVRLVVAQSYCPKCCSKSKDSSAELPFFTQTFTYLDFLAILPFYVELIAAVYFGEDGSITDTDPGYLVFLDIFKLFRIFRVFKLIRLYSRSAILFQTLSKSLPTIKLSLTLLFLLFTTGGGVLLCLEPCNGDPFTNDCSFPDIFMSGYYTWITVFSVGYGDQVPQNISSKILGMVFMLLGTIFLAMPLTIMGTLYNETYTNYENAQNKKKKKQKSIMKDELPKSERMTRLLKTGMLAFNSILQAEHYLTADHSDGPSDADVEEKSDGSSDDAKKTPDDESEVRPIDPRKQAVDIHKHLYVLQVYHYNISKDLVALYSSLERFKPPKPRKLTIKLRDQDISVEFEESKSKSSRRCSFWRGINSKVVPEMQEDADTVKKKPWVKDKEELRKEASKANASWRDKLWLWLENPSSRSRKIAGRVRAVILFSSFIVTMVSAWPEFQLSYGPAAPSCERAARDYCNLLHALPDDWKWPGGKSVTIDWSQRWNGMTKADVIRANPYCFEMTCGMLNAAPVAQATPLGTYTAPVLSEQNKKYCRDSNKDPNENVYTGCSDGSNAHCSWPVVHTNYSFYDIQCPTVIGSSTATVETQTVDATGKLVTIELTTTITNMSGPQPFDTSTLGQQIQFNGVFPPLNEHHVPVCHRKVCQNLEEDNITNGIIKWLGRPYGFNKILLIVNTFLVVFFVVEFCVKLLAMRSPKRFFLTLTPGFYHWAELLVLLISLIELSVVSEKFSTSMEDSAESGDAWGYEVFGDPFFSFPSDNFRVWSLVVPLRFILQMRDISMIRVIASTYVSSMRQLLVPILAMVLVVVVLSALLFTFETAFACTVARVRNNQFDDGSVAFRYVPNYPHTYYKDGPHDETDPTECPLQNYVDSIWLGFVTMTSVGYGVYVPNTFLGKVSSLMLGVFGAFYMSMPLTIVGSKFSVNYRLDKENERSKKLRRKFRKFVDKLLDHTTFQTKRVFYTDGAHVEVSMPQQRKEVKVWKEAVVIQVKRNEKTNADQGIYQVQYKDGTTAWVHNRLMRHLDAHAAARATRSNLAVFRKHMQMVPPDRRGFSLVNIMRLKKCHQQLMRCLGNIYEEETIHTRAGVSRKVVRSKSKRASEKE